VVPGAPAATGARHTGGRTGKDPHPARPSLSSGPDAPGHRWGRRSLRDRRPTGRAAGPAPPRSQDLAAGGPTDQGMDAGAPASARSRLLHRPQGAAPGTFSRLWGPWPRRRPRALLGLGHGRRLHVAPAAWRDTTACQLGALHPDPGRHPPRATPPDRGEAAPQGRLRGRRARPRVHPRNRMREPCPSGSVRGAPGHRRPYRGGAAPVCAMEEESTGQRCRCRTDQPLEGRVP
jgi:hypothetical protein